MVRKSRKTQFMYKVSIGVFLAVILMVSFMAKAASQSEASSKITSLVRHKKPFKKSLSSLRSPNKKTRKKTKQKVKQIAQIAKTLKYAKKCSDEFANDKGLGELGSYIKRELSSGRYPDLLNNSRAFHRVCPGFKLMSKDERKDLWVLILMSMSHFESSCRAHVKAQGPHGIAKGLMQLHSGAENRYVHWDQKKICDKGDASDPELSLQCSLSMLNGQVSRFNSVFYEGSYWDVLRNVDQPLTQASKIKSAIQMIPECQSRAFAIRTDRPNPSI